MVPGKNKQDLGLRGVTVLGASGDDVVEGSGQVVPYTWWGFVCDLQTGLKEDRGELLMRFGSQPETELGVRFKHLEFFFKH